MTFKEKFLEYSILRDLMQNEIAQYVHWTGDYRLNHLAASENVHAVRYYEHVKKTRVIEEWFEGDSIRKG